MSTGLSSKIEATRNEINLRNLRRHDPSIDKIISSTSYVTVYYNEGAEWVKTGIEGPMFLFSRSNKPQYGFFVLNRQGLEYTQEFLTGESDVTVEGEIILYEPRPDADRATGIWIAEEKDRVELCRRMEELRLRSIAPPSGSQPSPLDFLFAAVSSPPPSSNTLQPVSPQPTPSILPKATPTTLDMLFASSAASMNTAKSHPPPAQPVSPPAPVSPVTSAPTLSGVSLLDTLFKSATPQNASPKASAASAASTGKPMDAKDLLAMLGHSSPPLAPASSKPGNASVISPRPSAASSAPSAVSPSPQHPSPPVRSPTPPRASKEASSSSIAGKSMFAAPLLSHDIFASLPPLQNKAKSPIPASPKVTRAQQQPVSPPRKAEKPSSPKINRHHTEFPRSDGSDQAAADTRSPPTQAKSSSAPSSASVSASATRRSSAAAFSSSPQLNRSEALELVDSAAVRAKVGMGAHEKEPLDQAAFVKSLQELMLRPAFATSLYARYLERFEDEYS